MINLENNDDTVSVLSASHPLTKGFTEHWEDSIGNVSNPKLEESWDQMFKIFDECIRLNESNESKRLILPMITGTGKTQGAIHACKNLPPETYALIVTTRTEEADRIAAAIGPTACSYHSRKKLESVLVKKVDNLKDTMKFNTLVVTHEMFKNALEDPSGKMQYMLHCNKKQRDLVIIDEQILMYKEHIVELDDLINIRSLFQKLILMPEHAGDAELSKNMITLDKHINELAAIRDNESNAITYIRNTSLQMPIMKLSEIHKENKLESMVSILEKGKIQINSILTGIDDSDKDQILKAKFLEIFKNIVIYGHQWVYANKKGTSVSYNSASELGLHKTVVILDATARENALYDINSEYKDHYHVYPQIESRSFSNLTINLISTHTGKLTIMAMKHDYAENLSKEILAVTTATDRIMVVGHKAFLPELAGYLPEDRMITTTNWGNITGSNEYKDTNVQFIFGLNHKPKSAHLTARSIARINIQKARGTTHPFGDNEKLENEQLKMIEHSDIIQETIQAIMRTQARKVVDADGNCDPTVVYLTVDDKIKSAMEAALKRYFPNLTLNDYTPTTRGLFDKIVEPTRGNQIINLLGSSLKSVSEHITFKELKKLLGFTPRQFNDAIKTDKFKADILTLGYRIYTHEKQKGSKGRLVSNKYFKKIS